MKNILIINLARFGDIVQTIPAVAGLREKYPGCRLTLMVNDGFVDVCRVVPGVSRIVGIDFKRVYALMNGRGAGAMDAYGYLKRRFDELRAEKFDRIINLTPHDIGVLMTFLAGDDHAFWSHINGWTKYYLNITRDWRSLTLNVVDLFKRIAGIDGICPQINLNVSKDAENYADGILKTSGIQPGQPVIGLQGGASAIEKKWPGQHFVECARLLAQKLNAGILLFGAESDVAENRQIAAAVGPAAVNLAGRTTVEQLCAFMQRTDILVTNDTGPMHIAAFCGTRVVCIHMGKEICETTGPYGSGNICLQPKLSCYPCDAPENCLHRKCQALIQPGDVFQAVLILRGHQADSWSRQADPYISVFDDAGTLDYVPLLKKKIDPETFYRKVLRRVFDLALSENATRPPISEISATLCRLFEKYFDISEMASLTKDVKDNVALFEEMAVLAEQALARLSRLCALSTELQKNVHAIKQVSRSLDEIEARIVQLGTATGRLAAIISLFKFEIESLKEKTVFGMAKESGFIYQQLKTRLETAMALMACCLEINQKTFIKQKIA